MHGLAATGHWQSAVTLPQQEAEAAPCVHACATWRWWRSTRVCQHCLQPALVGTCTHTHTLDGQTLSTVTFTFCQSPRCTDRSRDSTGQLDHYQTTTRGLLYDKAFFFPKIPLMPGYLCWFQRLLLINPFSLESKKTRDLT